MLHSHVLQGLSYQIRPVQLGDEEQILALRTMPDLAGHIHPTPSGVGEQRKWIENYLIRENDFYFIVEKKEDLQFEGTISLYNIQKDRAEWGRWLLRPGSLASPESAYLIYKFAFEVLGLNAVYCRTVASNRKVISFHSRCELKRGPAIKGAFNFGGNLVDAVEYSLQKKDWTITSHILLGYVKMSSVLLTKARG